jgi:hypothetical protein
MIAGLSSEKAGIEAIPLLFILTVIPAFNFDFVLSDFSCEKVHVKMNNNTVQIDILILFNVSVCSYY